MYKLLEDYSGNGIDLKKGLYTHEELVKLYPNEDTLNYCLTCTTLKDFIEIVNVGTTEEPLVDVGDIVETDTSEKIELDEVSAAVINEEGTTEEPLAKIVFLVEKDIKQKKKVVFKANDKLTFEQLEGFDIANLISEGFLSETKILG